MAGALFSPSCLFRLESGFPRAALRSLHFLPRGDVALFPRGALSSLGGLFITYKSERKKGKECFQVADDARLCFWGFPSWRHFSRTRRELDFGFMGFRGGRFLIDGRYYARLLIFRALGCSEFSGVTVTKNMNICTFCFDFRVFLYFTLH